MKGLTVAATVGIVFAAVYMLWMFQRVMFGTVGNEKNRRLPDMNAREAAYMLPLLLFVFWIGLHPQTFLRKTEASVTAIVTRMEERRQAAPAVRPTREAPLARVVDTGKRGNAP
jgi:NADH-quinone oxidoreductase subunit M